MARICKLCGRGPSRGASRSHSNIKSKKWVKINLQPKKLGGTGALLCTKCLKTINKKLAENTRFANDKNSTH